MHVSWTMAALMVLIPAAASAEAVFFPLRDGPSLVQGIGGTSLASHGITVWTHGMPAHPFRVLGSIRDVRTDKVLDGNAVTSAAVAKLARAHGGNAVLLRRVSTRPVATQRGGVGGVFGTPSYSGQGDVVIREVTTDFVVIRSGRRVNPKGAANGLTEGPAPFPAVSG